MGGLRRRDVLITVGAVAAAQIAGGRARAAAWPQKDIAFIIPYGAGGGFDISVRALVPVMERYLPGKVSIVPTNIASGEGARGASQLYRARPDGYTIGIFNIPGMFVAQQEGGQGYDLARFTWLGGLGRDRYGIAVGWNSPVRSVADLQALARTRPVKFTSTGPSSTAYGATRIAAKLLDMPVQLITGYKGSNDYILGAARGDGDAAVVVLADLRRMQASQVLRVIASFEEQSSFDGAADATSLGLPDLAQLKLERLIAGPPGLPADIRDALATALAKALADPEMAAWARTANVDLSPETAAEAERILGEQARFFDRWKSSLGGG